jgi:putative membrane protein
MERAATMNYQYALLLATMLLLAITLFHPPYPHEQWLQHAPTVVALAALWWAARNKWLSTAAFACLVAFLALHIFGARWIYSNIPYERWCDVAIGSGPREWFGWTRNHYDRLVHLAFGLLMPLPVAEAAVRHGGLSRGWALAVALAAVASAGAAYEIFEWLLAMIAAPEYAERYNGQQGDIWDGQKDMALAMGGSIMAVAWLARSDRLRGYFSPPAAANSP